MGQKIKISSKILGWSKVKNLFQKLILIIFCYCLGQALIFSPVGFSAVVRFPRNVSSHVKLKWDISVSIFSTKPFN